MGYVALGTGYLLTGLIIVLNILGSFWISGCVTSGHNCLSEFQTFLVIYNNIALYLIYIGGGVLLYQEQKEADDEARGNKLLKEIYEPNCEDRKAKLKKLVYNYKGCYDTIGLVDGEETQMMALCTRIATVNEFTKSCGICVNQVVEGDKIVKNQCDHEFHLDCIITFLKNKPYCPFCKNPFRERLLNPYLEAIEE